MPTTQTVVVPPPIRGLNLPQTLINWLFTLQNLHPLNEVDTSQGQYSEEVPPAGLNSTTGTSNQNQEITFVKVSGDGNTYTLNGAEGGPLTLAVKGQFFKIKSDGTLWWQTG
jgi:hypothetical protein